MPNIAGQRVGIKNAYGFIVWNYGDSAQLFNELIKNYVDCRDYLYTRDFCKNCDWVSDEIHEIPLLDHNFELRHDLNDLIASLSAEELEKELAKNGIYEKYEIFPATCENPGTYGYKCKNCGEIVFQGFSEKLGHWYYTVSREEAANMSADELEKHLNKVGENESACLSPNSVTVECVDCGVRYAYGSGSDVKGHDWKLIAETDNDNILCGDLLSSATLAYCNNCGLVAELTGTTPLAKNCATYLGKEDLTETQQNTLKNLLDKNDNLCVKVEDEINDAAVSLVVAAFKSTEMRTHSFVNDPEHRLYLVEGNCEAPGAYIVLCSICGGTAEHPNILADTEDYTAYLWTLRDKADSLKDFWDGLKYSNFNKGTEDNASHTYQLPGEDEATEHTGHELYQALVAKYLTDKGLTEAAAAFDKVKGNVRYSGFNFTGFKFEPYAHEWLIGNGGETCKMDPMLTLIFEDYVGGLNGKCVTTANGWSANSAGLSTGNYYSEADGVKTWKKVSEFTYVLKAVGTEYKDESWSKYADVIEYLVAHKELATSAKSVINPEAEGYAGVADWCAREACPLKAGDKATAGFVAAGEHENVINIFKKGYKGDVVTDAEGNAVEFAIGTWAEGDKADVKNLGFLQYLYDNFDDEAVTTKYATEIATLEGWGLNLTDEDGNRVNDLYVYAKGRSGENIITCRTVELCKYCGRVLNKGSHVDPRSVEDAQKYLANCQHGDMCVVCEDYTFTGATNHLLVNYWNLDEKLQAVVKANATLKALVPSAEDNHCWDADSQKQLYVCAGCLEAGVTSYVKAADGTKLAHDTKKDTYTLSTANASNATYKTWNYYTIATTSSVQHTYAVTDKNVDDVIKLFGDKITVPTTFEEGTTKLSFVKNAILEKFGTVVDGKVAYTYSGANGNVFFDEEGNLVFQNDGQDKESYECVGAVYSYNFCVACAYMGENVKITKNTTWGTSGTKEVNKAKAHAYAPMADYKSSKTYYVDEEGGLHLTLTCIRCGESVTGYYKDYVADKSLASDGLITKYLEQNDETKKTWVAGSDLSDYENETFYTVAGLTEVAGHSVEKLEEAYTVGGKTELEGAGSTLESGYYTLTGQDTTISGSASTEISGNVVFELADDAKLTATNGISVKDGGSLTVKGGTIEGTVSGLLSIKMDENAEGGTLTLEGTTVKSTGKNGCVVVIYPDEQTHVEVPITVNIKDSRIQGGIGLFVNGEMDNVTLNITNSAILGDEGCGLSVCGKTTVVAKNSVFFGSATAVQMASGTGTFTDCTFVSAGDVFTPGTQFGENTAIPQKTCGTFIINHRSAGYDAPVNVTFAGNTFITAKMQDNKFAVEEVFASEANETQTTALNWVDSNNETHLIGYYEAETEEPDEKVTIAIVDADPTEQSTTYVNITTDVDLGLQLNKNVFVYSNSTTQNESVELKAVQAMIKGVDIADKAE